MVSKNAIEISDLRKSYGDTEVLKGIDLQVERGTMLALLGPNGAGKSTTVRILSTLIPPSGGQVLVNGLDVVRQATEVRRSIGLVSQTMAIDYVHSGRENLVMLGRLHRIGRAAATRRAAELLEQFDLVEAGDRPVMEYSGGMKRRLDLAVSLITSPPIVFLDEPTVGLDPRSRRTMWAAIEQLLEGGSTVLLTTQYLEEADQLADQVAVIDNGTVVAQGTPAELKGSMGSDRMVITFADEGSLRQARASLVGPDLEYDEEEKTLTVAAADASALVGVVARIEQVGVSVASMAIDKPTLDDVFLKLTARNTPKQQEPVLVQEGGAVK